MNNTNFKKLISAAELVRLRWRPHGWLLWQMIPQGGITLLAGETSSGKTLLGLDLALGLASGRGRAWDMEIREQVTGSREQVTGNWDQDTDNSGQVTGNWDQDTDNSGQVTGNRDQDIKLTREWTATGPSPAHISSRAKDLPGFLPSDPCPLLPDPCPPPVIASAAKQSIPCPLPSDPCPLLPDPCPPPVRYFCADADPNLMAERMLRLCRGYPNGKKGMGIEVPRQLDLDFSAHQFSEPESFGWLQKEVIRQGYHLLIFDGLSQYLPGMADGSARTVGAFLQGLRQLASQTGVTILLIHQFNKRQAARIDKWGLPTSQGEERVRGSSELLAGVDSVLLLSRPEAIKLGGMGRALLKVVKNRLGQAGARLQFTIVDGENSLHLLFERLGQQAQPKPRRLVDAALDEMMRILMEQDQRKFNRAELTKLLQQRMNLPSTRSLTEAFRILGKEPRVRVERGQTGKKCYAWANPGTGAMEKIVYGLPPAMALDLASSYLLSKARLKQVDQQWEKLQKKNKPSELEQRLADFMKEVEGEGKENS